MKNIQSIMMLSLRIQKAFDLYKEDEYKQRIREKFIAVWGETLAIHFLMKYNDAESFICALDDDNIKLLIDKY